MKWFDNQPVTITSTCASVYPLCTVDGWERSQRQSISISCPAIVGKYNQNMGGVDPLDALVSYYRIGIRSKKYYHLFFHLVDVAVMNGFCTYTIAILLAFQIQSKKIC